MLTEEEIRAIFRYADATAKFYKTQHEYEATHNKTREDWNNAWRDISNAQNDLLRLVRR